jgi:hypothetical protein
VKERLQPDSFNSDPTTYSTEIAAKATEIKHTGVLLSIGTFDNNNNNYNPPVIYDYTGNPPSDYITADHRGYLYTQQAGTNRFNITYVDDTVFVFRGTQISQLD